MTKKFIADWTVREIIRKNDAFLLRLVLEDENQAFPETLPGQFVQVLVKNSASTYLRRPISIHFVEPEKREIHLLIQITGEGTRQIAKTATGDKLNLICPLGNSFSLPERNDKSPKFFLLIGGGVGAAPLLYLGHRLRKIGYVPDFLLGAYSKENFFDNRPFETVGNLFLTTEDGSAGSKGYVTNHPVLETKTYDFIYTCGPRPMMQAVAQYARKKNIPCEISLENTMACGIGACLCCVEKTVYKGNVCVCTEGPVFNINELLWLI
ncbi:MAG: dihydroorotate dehydrogenase electron transfer subunit [Dysgonamonadaceae bacterium]|jgi:dihydroorotate dehydrogenase electron transfer subunit|nr:dihydroorotate dehydrogenase electron transfer subunit [Dysgonamonadaceae bacterium]